MYRYLSYLFLLLVCFSCSKSKPKYVIGVSQCSEDIWRNKLNDELRRGAYSYDGTELLFVSANDNDQKQIEQIDQFVNDDIDLLIVSPNQVATISPAIDRAYDKGIPVIVFDRKTNSKKFTAFIGADNAGMGREMGEYVASRLGGKGRVVEIRGLKGSSPAIERHKGFEEAISKYPGIQIVASLQGDWTEKSGKEAMEQLLREGHPGKIDFVFGQNDRMAVGAYKAMKEANHQGTLFCGIDALPSKGGGIECVRDGILDASYIYPTHGDEVMHLAMNILEGKPYQKDNPLKAALVTKANAHVLLMQNEEIVRQDGYLSELKQKADSYLVELSSQRLLTFLSIGFIGLLLLSAVIIYLYQRQRTHINKEREQMARAQLNFYTQVSHELRTPLTLIEGPLAQLATTPEVQQASETTSELFAIVRRNTDHLSALVNKILDAEKEERGEIKEERLRVGEQSSGMRGERKEERDMMKEERLRVGEQSSGIRLRVGEQSSGMRGERREELSKSSLLIVDDNPDIRTYLRTILENRYEVTEAADGKSGLEVAHASVPDLIISDVMMPVMNGLEFCQQVKQHVATSHIPVILLTARALSHHQVEGYESGADAYLTKPFSPEVLLARVENLLKSREKLKELFNTPEQHAGREEQPQKEEHPVESSVNSRDRQFVERLRQIIQEKMTDSNLSVEDVGAEIGLSRVQLYRKVKALTGSTPVDLIRKARLAKARELLQTTGKTVSEVAYDVGFSAPSYFTKCFKEEYGMLPGDLQ